MSTKYELKNGEILRDGVKIADRDPATGKIDYLADMDRYRAPVTAFLKEMGEDKPPAVPPEVAARQAKARQAGADINVVSEAPADEVRSVTSDSASTHTFTAEISKPTPAEQRVAELEEELARLRAQQAQPAPAPVAQPSIQQTPQGQLVNGYPAHFVKPSLMDAPVDPIKLKHYPGAPKMDPQLGDKTPEFVRYLAKNHPDDARQRYLGRKIQGGKDIEDIIKEMR